MNFFEQQKSQYQNCREVSPGNSSSSTLLHPLSHHLTPLHLHPHLTSITSMMLTGSAAGGIRIVESDNRRRLSAALDTNKDAKTSLVCVFVLL